MLEKIKTFQYLPALRLHLLSTYRYLKKYLLMKTKVFMMAASLRKIYEASKHNTKENT